MSDRDDEFREGMKSLGLDEVSRQRADKIYGERKQRIVSARLSQRSVCYLENTPSAFWRE